MKIGKLFDKVRDVARRIPIARDAVTIADAAEKIVDTVNEVKRKPHGKK